MSVRLTGCDPAGKLVVTSAGRLACIAPGASKNATATVNVLLQGEVTVYTAHDHREGAPAETTLVGLILSGAAGPVQVMPVFLDLGQNVGGAQAAAPPLGVVTGGWVDGTPIAMGSCWPAQRAPAGLRVLQPACASRLCGCLALAQRLSRGREASHALNMHALNMQLW